MYKSSLSASLPSELCSAHCQAVLQALSSPPTPARASATSSELDFDASEIEAYPAWKLSSHSVATTAESHGEPFIAQRTVLELPYPIIQRLIACAGAAGAAAAQTCTSLAKAWADALACPELFARFLLSKHGATTAMFYIYSEGAQRHLLKNASSTAEQDCVLDAVVGHLLQAGASIRPQARFLMATAAGSGHVSVLRRLLAAGMAGCGYGGRALVAASAAGHIAAMRLLLSHGVSARTENSAALRAACAAGQLSAVRLLLQHGADMRAAAGGALTEAARGGHIAVVLELLVRGADPCAAGGAALVAAAAEGHASVAIALLVAGAGTGPGSGVWLGQALAAAGAKGHVQVVQALRAAQELSASQGSGRTANSAHKGAGSAPRGHSSA